MLSCDAAPQLKKLPADRGFVSSIRAFADAMRAHVISVYGDSQLSAIAAAPIQRYCQVRVKPLEMIITFYVHVHA